MSTSHPLGAHGDGSSDALEQGDSSDSKDASSEVSGDPLLSPSPSLPPASFSRRAATVSSGSPSPSTSSPFPGLPARRTSGASNSARPSILSKDSSFFSSPILGRRIPSTTEGTRERSGSIQNEEPTAKDVSLMSQGTQAYAMLKRIQEHPIELADIIRLLVTKKAILILPTCPVAAEEQTPNRMYYEDHVIIPESNHGESLFVTLSGMRGILRPASSSITMLGMTSGQDTGTLVSDASGPTKRSFFDNISKSVDASSSEEANENSASHLELKLVNSSKRPVVIFVESVGSVHALLLDHPVVRQEGDVAPTPIVPLMTSSTAGTSTTTVSLMDRAAARRTASSAGSSVRSASLYEDTGDLPKLPKIATDLPLEWDSMVRGLESMAVKLKRNPLLNPDRYANELQRKYDEVRERFEVYGSASGMNHRWSDQDYDEVQQWVEAWLCRELYHTLFAQPGSVDFLHDEQLQAKIAALNFLDLSLEHLGFVLEHPEDVAHIADVVREGGVEMQKLALVKSPTDKMNVILSSHRVVVNALNREPAVQELITKVEEAKKEIQAESGDGSEASKLSTAKETEIKSSINSKRTSMPKILMDGVIPRANSDVSLSGARSPKIMMDEGFERPFSLDEKNDETEEPPLTSNKIPEEENPKTDNTVDEVDPASVELPKSPALEEPAGVSMVLPKTTVENTDGDTQEEIVVADSASASGAVFATEKPTAIQSTRKQYSADVLLPLLIFSVVKSNPPMLISNLRYIQRFKVQDHLTGELAYCLTNMMAVVSFLENLDPHTLGLSSDIRVLSDMSDIQVNPGKPTPTPLINFQEGLDQTKALSHKVSQDIVGVAEEGIKEGIKVISDVVQDYSKFWGRFTNSGSGGNILNRNGSGANNKRSISAASSLAATVTAANVTTASADPASGLISPALLTKNVSTVNVDSKPGENSSTQDLSERNRVLDILRASEGPQIQFMACTDHEDLRICDVKSLLQDYQRIGKLLEEMRRQV
ncbi:hypothetical protein EMPS_04374 [Entomortierella parvispora]|uniref:VPS9 domain-containing protein n=1 Tax=Entomortierella parvispora TaxID=205924 RepID=A0A9P3H950_9FUNG|nr:hypothetical protein EMPS_04374 [Entomortierella parvispora]